MASASCSSRTERARADPDILIIEPFYCGSHKQLVDCLMRDEVIRPRVHLVTMSGKKWHWRARVSALHLTSAIPVSHHFRVLFSSSVLNLAELVALRKDLAGLHKVLYFHENQLQYPVRKQKDRDFQYGYNQILSCLVADSVLFNSAFNLESFLSSITSFLKLMPDYRPKGLADALRPKCSVAYFPMQYPHSVPCRATQQSQVLKNVPTSQATHADHAHDMKSNTNKTLCPLSLTMRANNKTDSEHVLVSQSLQTGSSGDSDMQTSQVSGTGDVKAQSDGTDRDNTTELHSQAKVGRMDDEMAIGSAGNDSTLKFQGLEGGDHSVRCHTLKAESPASALTYSCGKRTVTSWVQCGTGDAGSSLSTNTCLETSRLSSEKTPLGPHHYRDIQCHHPPGKHWGSLNKEKDSCLHIVWPHRWEHDKDPQTFFEALFRLQSENMPFVVSVLGETFTDVPDIFAEAEQRLKGHLFSWGYQSEKSTYFHILQHADVVVSTSKHEFFGVAMLEAVFLGCYPLCPKALVYPELYPEECLYSTSNQLYKRLRSFCQRPHLARQSKLEIDLQKYSWETLRPVYLSKLQINC
ncbi:tRNA-queuosine alpha-mannosyltransferase-like [Babylonia areolata]|uniref:tRNA-queuosine alpha-mannosyltransferase-like n=1 Tax=Babylonia areolata TaxID=304850 RepID=UPI003FD5307A